MQADLYFGVVEDRFDPKGQGRVRVRVFGLHNIVKDVLPTESLPWAIPVLDVTNAGTSGIGEAPVGMVEGSNVLVAYFDKYKQMPYVIGVLPGIPGAEDLGSLENNIIGDGSLHESQLKSGVSQGELAAMSGKEWIFDSVKSNLDKFGVTDEYSKNIFTAGICAVGWGECGLDPDQSIEKCYYSDPARLRSIFRVFKNKPDSYVNQFVKTKDRAKFFEEVYGHKTTIGNVLGNKAPGDGAKYAGMGMFQLTGRGNYTLITKILKEKGYDLDLVKDPTLAIKRENFGIVALAYCESRNIFATKPTNPNAWFESLIKKVGNNVGDNYNKKRSAFNQFLNGVETHNFLEVDANTRYKVGTEVALKPEEVKQIEAQQQLQATNVIESYTNPKIDLISMEESRKNSANENREIKLKETEQQKEFYKKVVDFRNEISSARAEQKKNIDASLETLAQLLDPKNVEYKTYEELKNDIEQSGGGMFGDIFGVFSQFTEIFDNFQNLYNEQVNFVTEAIDNASSIVDDNLNSMSDMINDSIEGVLGDIGVEAIGDLDFITPEIKNQKDKLDSIILGKHQEIQNQLNAQLQDKVFDKVNDFKDQANSLINQIPTNLQALMNRAGLYGVVDFLNDNAQLDNILNSLFVSLQSKIGLTPRQILALTDQRVNNKIYGFCDPNGKYPLRDLVGEPATNKIARGKLDRTLFEWMYNNQATDVSVAGSDVDDDNARVSIPVITPKGEYPYTSVKQTESGHLSVRDDSPNNEMIGEYHRTGSGYGIDASGNRVSKIIGDDYTVIDNNGVITIAGKLVIEVADGASITFNNNSVVNVKGIMQVEADSINAVAKNDINLKAGNNINLEAANEINVNSLNDLNINSINKTSLQTGRDLTFKSAGKTIIDSADDVSLSSNANLSTYVEGNSSSVVTGNNSNYTKGSFNNVSDGIMNFITKSNLNQASNANVQISSKGNSSIFAQGNIQNSSNGTFSISSKGKASLSSSADLALKGGSNVSLTGSSTSIKASGTVGIDGASTYIQSGRAKEVGVVSVSESTEVQDTTTKSRDVIKTEVEHKAIEVLEMIPIIGPFKRNFKPSTISVPQSNAKINMIEKDLEDV